MKPARFDCLVVIGLGGAGAVALSACTASSGKAASPQTGRDDSVARLADAADVVTCRTDTGWSSPAFFTITGGTVGVQLGVQSLDLAMLAMSERGRGVFASDEIRLGGDVAATAGPEGRGRSEDTSASLRSAILTYSQSRGLFAGVDLSGVVMHTDADAMRAFYGHEEAVASVLQGAAVAPSPADGFLSRVRAAF